MQAFLNPAEFRATLLGLAAWAGALVLLPGVDFGSLFESIEGALQHAAVWQGGLSLLDIDEALLAITARPGGLWRLSMPTAGPGLATVLAGVAAVLVVRRSAAAGCIANVIRSFVAFALCQERRAASLHYTSEQFWLRVRGR